MIILGIDIGIQVCCCKLECYPDNVQAYYQDNTFVKLSPDLMGLQYVLNLRPQIAVLEPSGVNYARLWVNRLAIAGVEIRFVDHKKLRSYRKSLGLPDKDDEADALALACYGLDPRPSFQGIHNYLTTREPAINQMRDLSHRLIHLSRCQSPLINRVKQDLAWQLPEGMNRTTDACLFWRWLAGACSSKKYDLELERTIGCGVEEETRLAAKAIVELQQRERRLELELRQCLSCDPGFAPYLEVFQEFGFGERIGAILLSQIYPLSNFLKDGKPEVIVRRGKKSGKSTARYLSLRRFCKLLGVSPEREQSGKLPGKTKKAGSQLCRTALWQWIFCRIEPLSRRLSTPPGEIIGWWFDRDKKNTGCVKLARSRASARAIKLLFNRLVERLETKEYVESDLYPGVLTRLSDPEWLRRLDEQD